MVNPILPLRWNHLCVRWGTNGSPIEAARAGEHPLHDRHRRGVGAPADDELDAGHERGGIAPVHVEEPLGAGDGGPGRKFYDLTDAGLAEHERQTAQWQAFTEVTRTFISTPAATTTSREDPS